MSKIISETFYGRREPQWLLERPKEHQSHFDQRGCVRQIKSISHRGTTRQTENDLPTGRSRGPSYFPEQPSVTADRQAVVYNALPSVTHRTASNTIFSVPIVEFMVPLCCGKCEEKVKEELENDEGVYKVVCDLHNQRVTVSSSRDPNWLLKRIKRMKKNSHFWRGSTHFKDAHYLATSFPSQEPSHHSRELSQPIDIPAYRESAPPHHRTSPRSQNQYRESAPPHHRTSPQSQNQYRESAPPHHRTSPQSQNQYRESAPPHHRTSPQSQKQRYVAPGSPYDDGDVETQYLTRNGDREYYYRGAEYQYKSSSPYEISYDAQMYDATAASFRDSPLHHGHLPSSYGQPYATEDYALHSTGYY